LKQEARPILKGTAITIGTPVNAILQKLIRQVAVTRVKLNAIKSRGRGALSGLAIIVYNAGDFCDVERAVRRGLTPTMRRRL
jgi:hypothetical protein